MQEEKYKVKIYFPGRLQKDFDWNMYMECAPYRHFSYYYLHINKPLNHNPILSLLDSGGNMFEKNNKLIDLDLYMDYIDINKGIKALQFCSTLNERRHKDYANQMAKRSSNFIPILNKSHSDETHKSLLDLNLDYYALDLINKKNNLYEYDAFMFSVLRKYPILKQKKIHLINCRIDEKLFYKYKDVITSVSSSAILSKFFIYADMKNYKSKQERFDAIESYLKSICNKGIIEL